MGFSKDRPLNINNYMHSPLGIGTIQGGIAPPVGCQYELLARFDVPNQNFVNAQILDTEAEGITTGRLLVTLTDAGTLGIVGNQVQGTKVASAFSTMGLHSPDGIARGLGKLLGWEWAVNPGGYLSQGWNDVAGIGSANLFEYALYPSAAGTPINQASDSSGDAIVGNYVVSTEYTIAIVLGGYAVNQEPWYVGTVGDFSYGAAGFIKGGVFVEWTLLWRYAFGADTPLYPAWDFFTGSRTYQIDNIRVPIYDYSEVLQPTNADWFTDPNGTSLDAHVPNVGGMWTENNGDWDIQGNKAHIFVIGSSPGRSMATVATDISDCFIRASYDFVGSSESGIIYRYLNNNNFWAALLASYGGGQQFIWEVNGGVGTVRSSVVFGPLVLKTYEITVILDGQDMQSFVDGTNRITFSSAFNQGQTNHGLRGYPGDMFDNFHINRRVGSQYDILDECL